jgi:hypothetical protein
MEKEPPVPPSAPDPQTEAEAPPFDPDPRLVTYRERRPQSDAPADFRAELERRDG